jgi:hypothetical protein
MELEGSSLRTGSSRIHTVVVENNLEAANGGVLASGIRQLANENLAWLQGNYL